MLIQEQYEQSTIRPSLLDVNAKNAEQFDGEAASVEPVKKKSKARAFFGFISKMCSTSASEREEEALSESIRPIKKPQAGFNSRDTEPESIRDTQ